jgi:hypothetical protein
MREVQPKWSHIVPKAEKQRAARSTPYSRPQSSGRSVYEPGSHGYKKKEQARLSAMPDANNVRHRVSGSTHESEHTIGFEPLNQTSGLKRGTPGRARQLENHAPAYQEVKRLHRDHIGTGTTGHADASGFNSHTYRSAQRSLVESGDVSSAVQLNQLGYAHMFQAITGPKRHDMVQADNSFEHMVRNLDSVTYAQGTNNVTVPTTARQKVEMHLSRQAAQTGRFPSVQEENTARALYGVPAIGSGTKTDG